MSLLEKILGKQKDLNKAAVYYKDQSITYSEIYTKALNTSKLLSDYSDEIISIYLPNSIDYYITYFSILENSSIVFPFHFSNTIEYVMDKISIIDCRLIITYSSQKERFEKFDIDMFFIDTLCFQKKHHGIVSKNTNGMKDIVMLVETSGSSNNSKMVMLSENNVLFSIESFHTLIKNSIKNEKALIVSFLGSAYGNTCEMLFYLFTSIPAVVYDGIVSMQKILRMIDEFQITRVHLVSTLLISFCKMDISLFRKYNLQSLKFITFGSSLFPTELFEDLIKRFPNTSIAQNYGMTEATSLISGLNEDDWKIKFGSIGKIFPNIKYKLLSENSTNKNVGELLISGPCVMRGYYKNPRSTDSVIKDGWLHTRDLIEIDDEGYLFYLGRIDRTIISSGYKIIPEEIEEQLLKILEIEKVMVYGKSDFVRDQKIVAEIVLKSGISCTKEEIIEKCMKYLPPFKIPHEIIFKTALPQTQSGKIKFSKNSYK